MGLAADMATAAELARVRGTVDADTLRQHLDSSRAHAHEVLSSARRAGLLQRRRWGVYASPE